MYRVRRPTFALHASVTRLAPAVGLLTLAALITGGAAANALGVQPTGAAPTGINGPNATTTAVSLFPTSAVVGQQFRMTASVRPTFGMPKGWADFTVDGVALPACHHVPLGGPLATCMAALSAAGPHTIGATFVPEDTTTLAGSTGAATLPVARAATLLVVLPATIPVAGRPFTPTVLVVPFAPGSGHPTGTVIVTDLVTGDSCSMTLPSTVCALPGAAAGIHLLRAHYTGDDDFRGADSPVVHQIVWPGGPAATAPTGPAPVAAAPITAAPDASQPPATTPAAKTPASNTPAGATPAVSGPAATPDKKVDTSTPIHPVTRPHISKPHTTPAAETPGPITAAPPAPAEDEDPQMCGALTEQPTC